MEDAHILYKKFWYDCTGKTKLFVNFIKMRFFCFLLKVAILLFEHQKIVFKVQKKILRFPIVFFM